MDFKLPEKLLDKYLDPLLSGIQELAEWEEAYGRRRTYAGRTAYQATLDSITSDFIDDDPELRDMMNLIHEEMQKQGAKYFDVLNALEREIGIEETTKAQIKEIVRDLYYKNKDCR
jgi:hypothetical protein